MPDMWYNSVNNKATAQRQLPVAWPRLLLLGVTMNTIPRSPGVYKITCTVTHKVYIGSTTDLRKRKYWHWGDLRQGRHHNRYLQNAWNKYGVERFTFEVIELVMFVEHLHEREQHWLDYYHAHDPRRGFNHGKIAQAPWLGRSHTNETRQKLSDSAKRRGDIEHARPYAAEWHRSAEGRNWHGAQSRQTWATQQARTLMCQQCGGAFETRASHSQIKYCSNKCRAAARRGRHADHETRICVGCGQSFSCNKYNPTQYCSGTCAAAHRPRDERGQFT